MRLIDADKFEVYSYTHTSLDFDTGVLSVLEKMDAAPTVDAVPVKHGHWISLDDGRTAGCSNCDGEIIVTEIAYEQKCQTMMFNLFCNNYHWCPKCGAKMDEVSE